MGKYEKATGLIELEELELDAIDMYEGHGANNNLFPIVTMTLGTNLEQSLQLVSPTLICTVKW